MAALTPQAVLAMCRERDIKAVDLRFMDFPGLWQHFTIPVEQAGGGRLRGRPRLRRLQHPRLAGDQRERHARWCRRPRRRSSTRSARDPDAGDDLQHPGPDHPRGLLPRPAQRRPQGGQLPEEHRHRRHRLLRPRGRVLHLRRRPLRPDAQLPATTTSTAIEGEWNRGRDGEGPNLGYKLRHKEGYFPVPPADQLQDIRNEMMLTMIECGTRRRGPAPRGRHRRPVRDRHAVRRRWSRWPTTCCMYKYIIKNVAKKYGKTVDVHAQAAVHATTAPACTRTSRCGRTASRCSPAAATRA